MKFNFKSYDNSNQSISYCEVDKCKKVIELREQLQAKEQECEQLKEEISHLRNEGKKSCAYCADYIAKEQECEMLKEQYKWYEHYKETALYNKDLCNEKSEQLDQLKAEVELLRQYKGSKQASYESMQVEWNKAVSQNKDLLKQNEEWQKQVAELKDSLYLWISRAEQETKSKEFFEDYNRDLKRENEQFKKTLAEIKGIAESAPAIDTELSLRILEKISEVEDVPSNS